MATLHADRALAAQPKRARLFRLPKGSTPGSRNKDTLRATTIRIVGIDRTVSLRRLSAVGLTLTVAGLALAGCAEQHPTRNELQERVNELEQENSQLQSQLEEANQKAQEAHDAAQEAQEAADEGSLDDAEDAAQRATDAADDADTASQQD